MTSAASSRPQPFLVVGAMKSGTTTLSSLLADHPDIELVAEKESSSFLNRETSLISAAKIRASHARAAGEVSTAYTQAPVIFCDPTIARAAVGDDLKIIAVLREPYSRALSHWRHWAQLGRNADGTMDELIAEPNQPYVQFSSYYSQLAPWVEVFGSSKVLVLRLEDYEREASNWTQPLSEFLGVPASGFDSNSIRKENAGDSRVVSRGAGSRIKQLAIYRKIVRPLIPPSARRRAALILGGNKGGYTTDPSADSTRDAFLDAVSADMCQLQQVWPHLKWNGNEEKPA